MRKAYLPWLLACLLVLAGCANVIKMVPEPGFKEEPRSRGGNKSPYTVFDKTYTVLDSAVGYKEAGLASWYGKKFHGRKTSNGERYNMYAVSAAHKSLPIPTFVKVTNQENGKTLIVRVNDRGPFHEGRIIDLSYAAALKLGVVEHGTARVVVEALTASLEGKPITEIKPLAPVTAPVSTELAVKPLAAEAVTKPTIEPTIKRYLQIAVYSDADKAEQVVDQISTFVDLPVFHKAAINVGQRSVMVGPVIDNDDVERISAVLLFHGIEEVFTVYDFD